MKIVTRSLLLAVLLTLPAAAETPLGPVPPQANLRVASVQLRIVPDHRDWTYQLGQPVKFTILVTADNTPVDRATVTYSVGPDLMPAEKKTAPVPPGGLVVDGGTMSTGGFIRCKATVEINGRTYMNAATAAFAPETIRPLQSEPADFEAFWQKGKEDLAKIPLEARLTLLPDQCTDTVNVYHVNFRTLGQAWNPTPPRIYGILCEPKAPGKYPAVLKVPGAGVRSYAGDPGLAARGAIVLEIGIHGIPVTMAKEVYDAMYGGALHSYWVNQLDNRDNYYYHRVYLGCVRANDFLASREMWDGKNLLVMGASQGGALSIATAALDPRSPGDVRPGGRTPRPRRRLAAPVQAARRRLALAARHRGQDRDDRLLRHRELREAAQGARILHLGLQRRDLPADLHLRGLQRDHRAQDPRG